MSKLFFTIPYWKEFSEQIDLPDYITGMKRIIEEQNKIGFIVLFEEENSSHKNSKIYRYYKKHKTSIFKQIIIGKLLLKDFLEFKKQVDRYINQSDMIKDLFDQPEFKKFEVTKNLYFK